MIKYIVALAIMCTSSLLSAMDCGNLLITIENATTHNCVLKHVQLYDGYFQSQPPLNLASGVTSPVIYLYQNDYGVNVELDYRCNDKVVIIHSFQSYCDMMAGYVSADAYSGNDLTAKSRTTSGGYWSGTPGQIDWKFED